VTSAGPAVEVGSQPDEQRALVTLVAVSAVASVAAVAALVRHSPLLTQDTPSFLTAAHRIIHHGNPVDAMRTPGYPLLLALTGESPRVAMVAQAVLFVLSAVGVAFLAQRATRRWWAGLVTGVYFSASSYQLEWLRTIGSEMLAIFLLTAVACFAVTFRPSRLWPSAGVVCVLVFTRLEFVLLPVLLLVLILVGRYGRRTNLQAVAAAAGIYALLAVYAAANGAMNGYTGISVVSPINQFGKVLQYRMRDEDVTARYPRTAAAVEEYLAGPDAESGPYTLALRRPWIAADHWKIAGDYAAAMVRARPVEFLVESARTFRWRAGWFLVVSGAWLIVWPLSRSLIARAFGLLAVLGLYDLAMVSVGGYKDWHRLQAPSWGVRMTLVLGTAIVVAAWAGELALPRLRSIAQRRVRSSRASASDRV
jgi:hypothetical protein